MSDPTLIAIRADILQITDAAVLVSCEGEETWLPLSQADFDGESGDADTLITLPEWLGDEKGLHDGAGMQRAPVIDLADPQPAPAAQPESTAEPQTTPQTTPTTPMTLTIHSFSDNGESARVEDRHGNQWDLPTVDFSHAEADITTGDTVLCQVQTSALVDPCPLMPDVPTGDADAAAAEAEAGEKDQEADETRPEPAPSSGSQWLKSETLTVSVPLDPSEREAVGDRMARALEQIADLQDELDSHRKHINAQIKLLEKEAEAARMEWREGKIEQDVYCDMVADYDELAIIWRDHVTGQEMKRRRMTAEERQFRLPMPRPDESTAASTPTESTDAPAEEAVTAPTSLFDKASSSTCINCGHLAQDGTDDLPEPCQSCAQSANGPNDNWTPRQECATCAHAQTKVNAWPCAGCALNIEEGHRGETPRWKWADASRDEEASPEILESPVKETDEPSEAADSVENLPHPLEVPAPASPQNAEAAGA